MPDLQYSVAVRNAQLAALESTVGASAVLKIRSGPQPANLAAADAGTVLATLALSSDWLSAPVDGMVALLGTWQDLSADATGTAGHLRIYASDGTTKHLQCPVTTTPGINRLVVDNTSFVAGESFAITSFTILAGNA